MTQSGSTGFRRVAILVLVAVAILAVAVVVLRHLDLSSARTNWRIPHPKARWCR